MMKLKVTKDKDFGIDVREGNDTHFSLCLFLSDIKYEGEFKELFDEIKKSSKPDFYFTISYNASRIEIFSSGSVISDQEDEYHWFLEKSSLKELLDNWKEILKEKCFPTEIGIIAKLLTESEYSEIVIPYTTRQ